MVVVVVVASGAVDVVADGDPPSSSLSSERPPLVRVVVEGSVVAAVLGAASTDSMSSTGGATGGPEAPSREVKERTATSKITPPATAATTGPLRRPESGCLCIESGQREASEWVNHCLPERLEANPLKQW